MRLRQAVRAARDLEGAKQTLESHGLREPFRDPGVKEFGLVVLCQSARLRRGSANMPGDAIDRRCQSHSRTYRRDLRPKLSPVSLADGGAASPFARNDVGAILSVDQPTDPASWRWGGPGWEERAVPGRLRAVEIGADADRWSALLDRRVLNGVMGLDDGTELRFARASDAGQGVDGQGVTSIELEVGGTSVTLP